MGNIRTALVAGASGSGKTLVAQQFQQAYVHSMDNYFRGPFDENEEGIPEFDSLKAVDFDAWVSDYHRIKEAVSLGISLSLPTYHFKTHEVTFHDFDVDRYRNISWIVLEGIFALEPRLHHLADIKVFVEAPFAVRVARRLNRDFGARSDDKYFILKHSYFTELSYEKHILPQKQHADLVIPNYNVQTS